MSQLIKHIEILLIEQWKGSLFGFEVHACHVSGLESKV